MRTVRMKSACYKFVSKHLCRINLAVLERLVAKPRKRHVQAELPLRTHGGKRVGAGRPPKGPKSSKPNQRHDKRPAHNARHPVHITLRIAADIASLRRRHTYHALREATLTAAKREDFRIVH